LPNDWTPAQRLAFRFGVVYLALFCLATQISGSLIPNLWFTYRGLGRLWPMREITHWVARTVFGVTVLLDDVSSGETLFFWIQWSWVLVAAVIVSVVWTLLARRRSYAAWLPWCRLAVRLALAASMIEYGMTKVLTTQFPAPPLTALVTPVGDMTLSALLWMTIGSAPAYQIVTGWVEVVAGVLLLLPWTVPLGALLALVSLLQVLLLNLTFDIGVKLVTMHLIVLAVILLVPMVRLKPDATLEVRLKADTTSTVALVLPIVFGAYLLGTQAYINWSFWQVGGGGRPKSMLYGIWNVERLSVDGQVRAAELNDYDRRWRRVIFDEPEAVVVQRTDDSFARYGLSIDRSSGTLALTKGNGRTWGARFTFDRASGDQMTVAGEMDGHRIEADLRRIDPAAFQLLNSRFRWIRPHDP
jgi:uncharacterized membrane protein YphA (DoxX/SURF4 family)